MQNQYSEFFEEEIKHENQRTPTAITYSKLTIETLEQDVKYLQS